MNAPRSTTSRILHPLLTPPTNGPEFDGTALPWTRLTAMLEAARWADSGWNRQPWRFVVGRVGDLTYRTMCRALTARNQVRVRGAGALVLALAQATDGHGHRLLGTEYELGLAVSRLALQARATGWRTLQMGGFDRTALADGFGVPADYQPFVIIAVGRPVPVAPGGYPARTRIPVRELAFTGRWGRPMPAGTALR